MWLFRIFSSYISFRLDILCDGFLAFSDPVLPTFKFGVFVEKLENWPPYLTDLMLQLNFEIARFLHLFNFISAN